MFSFLHFFITVFSAQGAHNKLCFPLVVNETSLEFVGCSFENGTCEWEDVSVGQCQWTRGRNASENTGPSVDHTLGTELGEATR